MERKRCNRKIVLDYINGNDIVGYELDELENNAAFMLDVMRVTMDKKMYNFCSEKLKHDYSFVRDVVELFADDDEFITQIVMDYINYLGDSKDIKAMELMIIVTNILVKKRKYDLNSILFKTLAFFLVENTEIAAYLDSSLDPASKKKMGLGFAIVVTDYGKSPIILDFYARKLLDTIFYHHPNRKFEEIIHHRFKTFEELKAYGIEKFIIDYVRLFDQTLASYLSFHLDAIESITNDILYLEGNWNNYNESRLERKKCIFLQDMERFIDDNHLSLNSYELLLFALRELNLLDILKVIAKEDNIDDDEIGALTFDIEHLSLVEIETLNLSISLANRLFKEDIIDPSSDGYDTPTNDAVKVYIISFLK